MWLSRSAEPGWAPFFADDADVDWRLVSFGGVRRDGIPALNDPPVVASDDPDAGWLADDDIVFGVEVGNVSFNAPASRFITAAIPANSFGVQAEGQLGAFEIRGILAQQKGSQLRTRVYTVGQTTTQPVDR